MYFFSSLLFTQMLICARDVTRDRNWHSQILNRVLINTNWSGIYDLYIRNTIKTRLQVLLVGILFFEPTVQHRPRPRGLPIFGCIDRSHPQLVELRNASHQDGGENTSTYTQISP